MATMSEERRLVTVLFADVTGSTALGEVLDPEDLRALLTRYFAIARDVVSSHGGTVEKFIGDAVMAVFGLPTAHGDDAERAVSAALELRDRVRADAALGSRMPIRLGVNTGEVVASRGAVEGSDFLLTGDAVNTAARLQQHAEPWDVLVGERTARAAAARFTFDAPIAFQARGKSHPVVARAVLGRSAAARRRVPLIGRDADLEQLELVARRVVAERRPFLVSIVASAGVGKTRLLEEFLQRLPSLTPDPLVALAQCLPYGQRLTYWPLRSVLQRLAGVDEEAPPDELRRAVAAWLAALGVADVARLTEQLAATVGASEADALDPSAIFAAWRTAVEASAVSEPLVLIFEDLHWSSDSLLDLVEYVMQPRMGAPILMIILTRPELLDRRPSWGGGRRNYVSLALEPLPDDAVAQVVRQLLEGAPDEIVTAVVERADGNPFYAGEIARALIERLGPSAGPGAIHEALATLPDTVQATVLARLDLLEPEQRRMLQLGAVFGRSFPPSGIARLAPELTPRVDALTDELGQRDLIRPSDGSSFAFRHILIREVAYQTLPRTERALLHAGAARWLEERTEQREDAYAELIAYHYREAAALSAALGLDDPGGVRPRAVKWLERAADTALAAAANQEALRHLRAAVELAQPNDLARLHERIGDTILDGRTSVEGYEAALRLARAEGAPPQHELRLIGNLLTMYTRWQGAVPRRPTDGELGDLFGRGEALLEAVDDPRTRANFLVAYAFLPFWRDREGVRSSPAEFEQAEEKGHSALAIAETAGDFRLQSAALDGLASLAQDRRAWREATTYARRRLEFRDHVELRERMDATSMVSWNLVILGDLDAAVANGAAGLADLQPGQVPNWTLHLCAWQTLALCLLGRWDEATSMAERARLLWIELGETPAGYATRGFVAAWDVARARQDIARMQQWRTVIEKIDAPFGANLLTEAHRALLAGDTARVAERSGRLASAPELQERCLSFCIDHDQRLPDELTERVIAESVAAEARIVEAQARRARGAARGDREEWRRRACSSSAQKRCRTPPEHAVNSGC